MKFHAFLLFGTLLLLSSTHSTAQDLDPGWLWAQRGGSSASITGINDNAMERIVDIAVDGENNYYYLAEVGGYNFSFGDIDFVTYNDQAQYTDIFIFSTDQDGNFRWSKLIGGGDRDRATSIGVDDQGYVYVSGNTFNWPQNTAVPTPVHFDTDSIMPEATIAGNPANKKIFLIKYDTEGNFQWLRQPESDNTPLGASGGMLKTVIESDGTTHSLLWLMQGTYFDGELEVEEDEIQGVIVKYNNLGENTGHVLLDMKPLLGWYNYQMTYDSNLDRYYIADTYRDTPNPENPLSINGYGADSHIKSFYLAAVDNQGEVIWYHENQMQGGWSVGDIAIDETGDIYFTGLASTVTGEDTFAGYQFNFENSAPGGPGPFLIKLNSDGILLWGTNVYSYSPFNGQSIVTIGENVYLGLGMADNAWGDLAIPGPVQQGLVPDIQVIKFSAQTGEALEVIQNNAVTPSRDMVMAMALDNNDDLVVGGYFGSQLFSGTDFHLSNTGQDSDFFIAKYHLPQDTTSQDTGTVNTANFETQIIKVYPNPTTGMINLRSDVGLTGYTLHDLQGRVVAEGRPAGNQVDLSARETGLYILSVIDQYGRRHNFRIVKNQ